MAHTGGKRASGGKQARDRTGGRPLQGSRMRRARAHAPRCPRTGADRRLWTKKPSGRRPQLRLQPFGSARAFTEAAAAGGDQRHAQFRTAGLTQAAQSPRQCSWARCGRRNARAARTQHYRRQPGGTALSPAHTHWRVTHRSAHKRKSSRSTLARRLSHHASNPASRQRTPGDPSQRPRLPPQ